MALARVNSFLKDGAIVAILPAPLVTRESSPIAWYETRMNTLNAGIRVDAVDGEGQSIEYVEAQPLDGQQLRATCRRSGEDPRTAILNFSRKAGETQVSISLDDGREFLLTSTGITEQERPDTSDNPTQRGRYIGEHWESIIDPILTLAEALKIRAADSNSWGCTSCSILLGGISAGTFVAIDTANPALGVGVIIAGATFVENCQGACA